jgi:hypothetical protein
MRYLKDHNKKSYRVSVSPQFACSSFQHVQATQYTARGKEELVKEMNSDHFLIYIWRHRVARNNTPLCYVKASVFETCHYATL